MSFANGNTAVTPVLLMLYQEPCAAVDKQLQKYLNN